jgi:uncharacterized membrane protein YphA (DoxX/SURF4 family)
MKIQVSKTALLGLQWSVGVVLFIEAAFLAFSKTEIHFAGHPGIHHWIRLALAWSEMLGCVLFLVPRAMKLGALALIIVLALAALVHLIHGNFQIGGLLIYAAAASVVASQAHS